MEDTALAKLQNTTSRNKCRCMTRLSSTLVSRCITTGRGGGCNLGEENLQLMRSGCGYALAEWSLTSRILLLANFCTVCKKYSFQYTFPFDWSLTFANKQVWLGKGTQKVTSHGWQDKPHPKKWRKEIALNGSNAIEIEKRANRTTARTHGGDTRTRRWQGGKAGW